MRGDGARRIERERRFRSMYEAHYPSIYNYSIRRVGVAHEAGDVVADVFATAWQRIDEVPDPPEERLWLYGVARKTVSQHRRTTIRRRRLADRLMIGSVPEPRASPSQDPDHDRLFEAMGELRPDDFEALRLVLWECLTHAEVAEVLGCSVNAVGIRVHRAKARLRDALLAKTSLGVPEIPRHRPIDPTRS